MIPRPRVNTVIYHGIFGPHARLRPMALCSSGDSESPPPPGDSRSPSSASTAGQAPSEGSCSRGDRADNQAPVSPPCMAVSPPAPPSESPVEARRKPVPRSRGWADLMRRVLDVRCAGLPRLRRPSSVHRDHRRSRGDQEDPHPSRPANRISYGASRAMMLRECPHDCVAERPRTRRRGTPAEARPGR